WKPEVGGGAGGGPTSGGCWPPEGGSPGKSSAIAPASRPHRFTVGRIYDGPADGDIPRTKAPRRESLAGGHHDGPAAGHRVAEKARQLLANAVRRVLARIQERILAHAAAEAQLHRAPAPLAADDAAAK